MTTPGLDGAGPILLAAFALLGCAVGPNYHRPAVQSPTVFHGPEQSQQSKAQSVSFADLPWWQVFHDPQLQNLIQTALKQNYDLQMAIERIFRFKSHRRGRYGWSRPPNSD